MKLSSPLITFTYMRLFNANVMPCPGNYSCSAITKDEFVKRLTQAWPNVVSSVGYMENIRILHALTGLDIPFNRDLSDLNDTDEILVMRLKNRVLNPDLKGKENLHINDFEFYHITYSRV